MSFINATLREALNRVVTNDHALLELLQAVQYQFPDTFDCPTGKALTDLILWLDGRLTYGDDDDQN